MTYRRVIPRDLFNEGNLLKCLGKLYVQAEYYDEKTITVKQVDDGPFNVFRPLNSLPRKDQ